MRFYHMNDVLMDGREGSQPKIIDRISHVLCPEQAGKISVHESEFG